MDDKVSFGFEDVAVEQKTPLVRGVFARAAAKYDLMNDLMSGGLHRLWKDAFAAKANPQPGEVIVDLAGGTGDIARRLKKLADASRARNGGDPARVHVLDINADMLAAGRLRGLDDMQWIQANAECLPLPDACADVYTIAFGIRNVTHRMQALREARRVLKPGGRFLCLEFSHINPVLRPAYDAFSFNVIPKVGKMVTGDGEPYQYLIESIRRFPNQKAFAAELVETGFARVQYTNFTGGACALHWGFAG